MRVRLIAKVSSSDEAKNIEGLLEARGATVELHNSTDIVLMLTTEEGFGGAGMGKKKFHAANWGEVQTFATWALEAQVGVVVAVHRDCLTNDPICPCLELTRDMLEDLARKHGPGRHVVCHLIRLAAVRRGSYDAIQVSLSNLMVSVVGRGAYNFETATDRVKKIAEAVEAQKRDHGCELAERDRQIVGLRRQLTEAERRAAKLANQRNRAKRALRKIRKATAV